MCPYRTWIITRRIEFKRLTVGQVQAQYASGHSKRHWPEPHECLPRRLRTRTHPARRTSLPSPDLDDTDFFRAAANILSSQEKLPDSMTQTMRALASMTAHAHRPNIATYSAKAPSHLARDLRGQPIQKKKISPLCISNSAFELAQNPVHF
jgi:hypothetical protein